MKLLCESNPKLMKGQTKGFLSFILHLAPASLSGYNVCPGSSAGCRAVCLNTSGHGRFTRTQEARIRKTKRFFDDRQAFFSDLVKDIEAGIRKATRLNLTPVFRLNGTSDIRWETIFIGSSANIMQLFPQVQFYDYTKLSNRKNIPHNYHLTFSRSESNDAKVMDALNAGMSTAVVFSTKKGMPLPTIWNGYAVIDGDETDLRFLDPRGVIVGLRGKGDAKKATNNKFIVEA